MLLGGRCHSSGNTVTFYLRNGYSQCTQFLYRVHELAITFYPAVLEFEGMDVVVLAIALRIPRDQKMIDLKIPQGFYNMGAMIGNRAGVNNPATDGLTFLDKAASLGNPPALTELGKLYIYVAKNRELGLAYTQCAASQGYAPANYELGSYYELVEHNFPKAARYYLLAASQGNDDAALFMSGVFDKTSPDVDRMWYSPDEKLHKEYYSIYKKLEADPDLRFPNLMKEHPLPPHPTQGYDADRPDWKPEQ